MKKILGKTAVICALGLMLRDGATAVAMDEMNSGTDQTAGLQELKIDSDEPVQESKEISTVVIQSSDDNANVIESKNNIDQSSESSVEEDYETPAEKPMNQLFFELRSEEETNLAKKISSYIRLICELVDFKTHSAITLSPKQIDSISVDKAREALTTDRLEFSRAEARMAWNAAQICMFKLCCALASSLFLGEHRDDGNHIYVKGIEWMGPEKEVLIGLQKVLKDPRVDTFTKQVVSDAIGLIRFLTLELSALNERDQAE